MIKFSCEFSACENFSHRNQVSRDESNCDESVMAGEKAFYNLQPPPLAAFIASMAVQIINGTVGSERRCKCRGGEDVSCHSVALVLCKHRKCTFYVDLHKER